MINTIEKKRIEVMQVVASACGLTLTNPYRKRGRLFVDVNGMTFPVTASGVALLNFWADRLHREFGP